MDTTPARLGLFVVLAFVAGAAVAGIVGNRESGGERFKMSYVSGEVRAVDQSGDSLCLVESGRSKEVCAPPALIPGQQLPKVGDRVYVARATVIREGEPDGIRHVVYLFPTLPPAPLQP